MAKEQKGRTAFKYYCLEEGDLARAFRGDCEECLIELKHLRGSAESVGPVVARLDVPACPCANGWRLVMTTLLTLK